MPTLVVAFERQPGLSDEAFRERYVEGHVPVVRELPNLTGYDVTFPRDPAGKPFDGIARLHFADMADLGEAMESDAADRMEADAAEFIEQGSLVQFVGESNEYLKPDSG